MIIDITEDERVFLERVCVRAMAFAELSIVAVGYNDDLEKVKELVFKLQKDKDTADK
jgi:hypothetical protein